MGFEIYFLPLLRDTQGKPKTVKRNLINPVMAITHSHPQKGISLPK
jgi:hypothetical protein